MKKNKFNEFYKIGDNSYSLLSFNGDLFIGTTSYLSVPKRFKRVKHINQGFKVLELSAPIGMLFDRITSAELVKEDKEFPDMNTYAKVDNKELRKFMKNMYDEILENEINYTLNDFNVWCNNFRDENAGILPEQELDKVIARNRQAVMSSIDIVKKEHKDATPIFKEPKITESKDLYNFTQMENIEFLYTQKVGSNLKINYFYELDDFGVITIYKVQTVKGYIKCIETFIYNRTVLQKLVEYMEKNKI